MYWKISLEMTVSLNFNFELHFLIQIPWMEKLGSVVSSD